MSDDATGIGLIDLPVNSSLLNPNFDGYKLDLDKLPVKELSLPIGVNDLRPSDAQFSYEQAKIFAHASQLFYDSWSSSDLSSVFIFPQKDGNFYRVEYNISTRQWGAIQKIISGGSVEGQALPPSIAFPSNDLVVLSNGSSNVIVYKTTEKRSVWEEILSLSPFGNSGIFIQDARLVGSKLEILVESVVDHEKTSLDDHKVYDLVVTWITINSDSWQVARKQDISLPGHVNFITLDENAEHLIVNSSESPKILADTDGLLPVAKDDPMETDETKKHYVWTERGDEVAIAFNLEPSVKKNDVTVKPGVNSILVSVGGNVILNGKLGGHIQPDSATWTLAESNKLEVTLFKRDTGVRWNFLVEGDSRGRYELDPLLLEEATAALEKFSCDYKVPGAFGASENFNSEQTEECDMPADDLSSTIYWFNKQKQSVVQQCDVTGNQFLFEKKVSGEPSKVSIRYDVDGLLFSFSNGKMVNDAVFAAFGYIQASKTNKRWCVSPSNHSYIVLVEASNHAFVYNQTTAVNSELQNRKTKEKVASIAKQYVVSLKARGDSMEFEESKNFNILAAHAENEAFFLLTEDTLYAICLQ